MAEYPELVGLDDSPCVTDGNMFRFPDEPLIVEGPYEGVNVAAIEQEPFLALGPASDIGFLEVLDNPEVDIVGGVGYESEGEIELLTELKKLSLQMSGASAFAIESARPKIIELTQEAGKEFNAIRNTYNKHAELQLYAYPEPSPFSFAHPLAEPDDTFEIDEERHGLARFIREKARDEIRQRWRRALMFLWCAQYGLNQSLAYRENKKIFEGKPSEGFAPTPPGGPEPGLLAPGEPPGLPPVIPAFPWDERDVDEGPFMPEGAEPEDTEAEPEKKKIPTWAWIVGGTAGAALLWTAMGSK